MPDGSAMKAFFESLINTINNGMITGKLRIAIKDELLPAFDAIAEISVKANEKPTLPSSIDKKKIQKLTSGFPIKSVKNSKANIERTSISMRL